MPTATATTHTVATTSSTIPLKTAASVSPSSSSTAATLRSLYPRAAKAFLHRDIVLTHSLLSSAFALISPPSLAAPEDSLSAHRRKWEVLRITFETTTYSSPPPSEDPEALPSSLRANQMLSPQSLVAAFHERSLQLFTPTSPLHKPSSTFLPARILVTLGLASLKLGCPDIGRGITEDWLARRGQGTIADDHDGYTKVLDLYCLQILPRLEEWDYAGDFLQYERELPQQSRDEMVRSLNSLQAQAMASRHTPSSVLTPLSNSPSAASSRTVSPAPSNSSESSTSTHTATPVSPRLSSAKMKGKAKEHVPSMTHIQPPPSTSSSSQSVSSVATSATVTRANVQAVLSRRNTEKDGSVSRFRSSTRSRMQSTSPLPRPPRSLSLDSPSSAVISSPSIFSIIRSTIEASVHTMTKSKAAAFILFVVIFPVLSIIFRLRRRQSISTGNGNGGVAGSVRRNLHVGALERKGLLGGIWEELMRSVVDTVKMGGRGLV